MFLLSRVNVASAVNILSSTSTSFGGAQQIDEKLQKQLLAEEEIAMKQFKVSILVHTFKHLLHHSIRLCCKRFIQLENDIFQDEASSLHDFAIINKLSPKRNFLFFTLFENELKVSILRVKVCLYYSAVMQNPSNLTKKFEDCKVVK